MRFLECITSEGKLNSLVCCSAFCLTVVMQCLKIKAVNSMVMKKENQAVLDDWNTEQVIEGKITRVMTMMMMTMMMMMMVMMIMMMMIIPQNFSSLSSFGP